MQNDVLIRLPNLPKRPNLLKLPSFSRGLSQNLEPTTLLTLHRRPTIIRAKSVRPNAIGAPRLATGTISRPVRQPRRIIDEM